MPLDTVPDVHRRNAAPRDVIELTGDEYALTGPDSRGIFGGLRLRARQTQPVSPDRPQLGEPMHERIAQHAHRGRPDPRRNDTVSAGFVAGELGHEAYPEDRYNGRLGQQMRLEKPPARPKAGFTGADPARPARFQLAVVMRPFDKLIASHASDVPKIAQPAPLASSPRQLDELKGGQPSPAGRSSDRKAGVRLSRNTVRVLPRPWDQGYIATDNGQPAPAASRGRRFR